MKKLLSKVREFDKLMHARMGVVRESRYTVRVGKLRFNTLAANIALGVIMVLFLFAVRDYAAMESHYGFTCASVACDNPFYQLCDLAPDICAYETLPNGFYGSVPGFFLKSFGTLTWAIMFTYIVLCFVGYRWWKA